MPSDRSDARGDLAEWQAYKKSDDDLTVSMNWECFHDVVADLPWGFLLSLTTQDILGGLKSSCDKSVGLPFPIGPAPMLKRTNERTGKRERLLFHNPTKSLVFASEVDRTNLKQYKKVRDQAYAEIVLRLQPTFFLTLYDHMKKRWVAPQTQTKPSGVVPSHQHPYGPCMVDRKGREDVAILYGRVHLCSSRLLSGLAHSYKTGRYQKLTMEEILTWDGANLRCHKYCLRHCILESREATLSRVECRGSIVQPEKRKDSVIWHVVRDCQHDPPCLCTSAAKCNADARSWASSPRTKGSPVSVDGGVTSGENKVPEGSKAPSNTQSESPGENSEIAWIQDRPIKSRAVRSSFLPDEDDSGPPSIPSRSDEAIDSGHSTGHSTTSNAVSCPKEFADSESRTHKPVVQCKAGIAAPAALRVRFGQPVLVDSFRSGKTDGSRSGERSVRTDSQHDSEVHGSFQTVKMGNLKRKSSIHGCLKGLIIKKGLGRGRSRLPALVSS